MSADPPVGMPAVTPPASTTSSRIQKFRAGLDSWIPASYRETGYALVSGAVTALMGFGVLDAQKAALWLQLGIGTVTCLFALLYATNPWRVALYALVGPVGSALLGYGILDDTKWAIITAAIGQVLGLSVAAAKAVYPSVPTTS